MNYEELLIAYNKLKNENILLKTEIEHLRNPHSNSKNLLINPDENTLQQPISLPKVHIGSKPDEKIELFMTLFHGRTDVYARRWYNEKNNNAGYKPVCENEWRHGLCDMKKHKCTDCPNRKLLPLDKLTIAAHLRGENKFCKDVIGIYSLLQDETCHFLAIDFDGENWHEDIRAIRSLCNELNVPVSIERSRSGNGGHAWFFFENTIPAATARKFGSSLLTKAMNKRHEISFKSYDRMFPNQDTMPKGGFGNLIALPLQGRARKNNNSVLSMKILPYMPTSGLIYLA